MVLRLRGVLPWAVVVVGITLALFIGVQPSSRPASFQASVRAIASGIRCPTCQGETVAASEVPAAKAIVADIARRLKGGQTPGQVRAYLVSRYGVSILESPPTGGVSELVWALPVVAVPAAAIMLVLRLRRSRPRSDVPPSDADRMLVAATLHQLDDRLTSSRPPWGTVRSSA